MWQIAGTFESSGMIPTFAATTPSLLLDAYPNAAFAYSFRKLRTAYAGSAVRIRESGGNTEQDFGFDGSGNFDSAGAATFIGANSGFITTWYDQSGNGLDVTQTGAASQANYVASGINSLPCLSGDGTRGSFTRASVTEAAWGAGTAYHFALVFNATAAIGGDWAPVMYWSGGAGATQIFVCPKPSINSQLRHIFSSSDLSYDAIVDIGGADRLFEGLRTAGDSNQIWFDGTQQTTSAGGTDIAAGTATLEILKGSNVGFIYKGQCSEFIFWSSDQGSGPRTNINTYYTIF